MNRHHYALYVHNCRLVFLLRKDFDQADTFRPAEFHWKLDQVWMAYTWHLTPAHSFAGGGWCVTVMMAVGRPSWFWLLADLGKNKLRETTRVLKSGWKLLP